MPRLVNCIKNCCYSLLLVVLVSAISSLFVWQAEVYQSTIDEQVRLMKMDMSVMKKENHLMEIKLNEQYGKHEDLKEEFRYLLKQAKWSVEEGEGRRGRDIVKEAERGHGDVKEEMRPNIVKKEERKPDVVKKEEKKRESDVLRAALDTLADDDNEEFDLSKRTHVLIVSEKYGGGRVMASLLSNDPDLFLLPAVGSVIRTRRDFEQITHCSISSELVEYYRTHLRDTLLSQSLSKFCPGGECRETTFTVENLERECRSKHVSVMQGSSEAWSLSLLDSLPMEVAYIHRDPRAVISHLLEDKVIIALEEVQVFASQYCERIATFLQHSSTSHYVYQVFNYEKLASSPITSLSTLYHQYLDTTHLPDISLSRDYRNSLYLSISRWKNSLPQIAADAVQEECRAVLSKAS